MSCILVLFVGLIFEQSVYADWEMFPESRHHLYQSYAFFIEQHNIVAWMGQGQFWAAVAGNLPIVGNNSSDYHPQFMFHISGNDSMVVGSQGGVYTQAFDTRIGVMYEMMIPQIEVAFSAGIFHESGHTVDGTDHPELSPLNLGDNIFRIRVLHDFGHTMRVGLTYDPIINSIPTNLVSGADEFVEYFPFGTNEDSPKGSPFVAVSSSHRVDFRGLVTLHAQLGVAWRGHFELKHQGEIRTVIGYYSGVDPRSKYAQFLNSTVTFGYGGIMFDF